MVNAAKAVRETAHKTRQVLGRALEALQERPDGPAEIQTIVAKLADAMGGLFRLEQSSTGSDSSNHLHAIKEGLSEALRSLKDVRWAGRASSVARDAVSGAIGMLSSALPADHGVTTDPPQRDAGRLSRPSGRIAYEADVGFLGDTNFYVGFSGELDDGGLFIATYSLVPIGTDVKVHFTLPDEHSVTALGAVAWVRDSDVNNPEAAPGIGVHLEKLPEIDMKSIRNFLQKRTPIFWAE